MERMNFLLLVLLLQLGGIYSHVNDVKLLKLTDSTTVFNLASPNYPDDAAPSTDLSWKAIGPSGSQLLLKCDGVFLEMADCSEGYLYVGDILGKEKSCKPTTSLKFESAKNEMMIRFTTGPSGKGRITCVLQLRQKDEVTDPTVLPSITSWRKPSSSAKEETGSYAAKTIVPSKPGSRASFPLRHKWAPFLPISASKAPYPPGPPSQSTEPSSSNSITSSPSIIDAYSSRQALGSRFPKGLAFTTKGSSRPDADTGDYAGIITQGDEKTSCPCGWANKKRIVGGDEAGKNEFIFMAYLRSKWDKEAACGGSILTRRHILTAAHCIKRINVDDMLVVVGGHDFRYDENDKMAQRIDVIEKYYHEKYNTSTKRNDIGLLFLARDIVFKQYIGPVCFPTVHGTSIVNQEVIALGWGDTSEGGSSSPTLQSVRVRVLKFDVCRPHYTSLLSRLVHLCTDNGPCNGDSGGPLVYLDPEINGYVQVGIITGGESCDNKSLNADLFAFTDWVPDIIRQYDPEYFPCTKI